ncbi:LLM class flavin-dependent oxidoreductase [Paracoccus sp. 11-3]|uniref:LLM class flavin-dependent oxidoreductase n=1 Tax=Paracoccus amoyensis TaxID=2760093 RepID=A0A926GP71_9RHOB|nr:LLM class flavin-dependent oxidoreductase [Paracoccus amoyensis]MBC9247445.1 LLM class flavin-dependent oxidoreductase [Paracoccus amoyensis]
MRAFGFLSFGHYGNSYGSQAKTASDMIRQAVEIGVGAEELGVNGAYFRVHHFARQQAAPIPLLTAIAAKTKRIEVGTGVIDMRYENPLHLAEEAAALDIIADGRIALGISRGSPETALRGYETFGYTGSTDPRGADIAREKFDQFLNAIDGKGVAKGNPNLVGTGQMLPIEPQSPGLRGNIWWGSATRDSAEWTGRLGLNMMSSTALVEDTGQPFDELQAEQILRFREAYRAAGHKGAPRVSVSRSIIPIMNETDAAYFGHRSSSEAQDSYGIMDGYRATSGRTYAAEPDRLIEELKRDKAIALADTLMLTIPNQLGPEYNLHILESFAKHVAPELGWQPNWNGAVTGDPIG